MRARYDKYRWRESEFQSTRLSSIPKLVAFIFIPGRLRETETRSRGRSFEAVTLEEKRQGDEVERDEEGRKKGAGQGEKKGIVVVWGLEPGVEG